MDSSESSPPEQPNFAFAFNDVSFSDRILRIEILPELTGSKPDPDHCMSDSARKRKRRRKIEILPELTGSKPPDHCMSDSARKRKRRRNGSLVNTDNKKYNDEGIPSGLRYFTSLLSTSFLSLFSSLNYTEVTEQFEQQVLNCNVLDLEENLEESAAMTADSPVSTEIGVNQLGHVAAQGNETSSRMDRSTVVKTIHISSPILAAKSPFFYKLFSNGMRESEQRHVTLRIQASEEAALMDLLNFMYANTVPRTTPAALLDVLMVADKYEVASCMRYCSRLLRNLPMTCESALLYLDLPLTVQMSDTVLPLTDAAKKFIAESFKDLSKHQEEVLNLPLVGIEAILFSDDLQVASEDEVYDFALKWALTHYPKLEERRQILSTRLIRFIHFPCMTFRRLMSILDCPDFDPKIASEVVQDALPFKTEAPSRQRSLVATKNDNAPFRCYVERAYKYKPVKVMEFESPHQQCIVYLDLKREEVANLSSTGRVHSQPFRLGGQVVFLSGHYNLDQESSFQCFGLYVHMHMEEKCLVSLTVDYEFASRMKPTTEDFVSKYRGNYTFTGEKVVGSRNRGKAAGSRNLFGVPWTAFLADDSPYFINGVLHLRAKLTIKK